MRYMQYLAVVACPIILVGCGDIVQQAMKAQQNDVAKEELRQLGLAYHQASDLKGGAPVESLDDLEATLAKVGRTVGPAEAVRDGRYTAVWGWKIGFHDGVPVSEFPFAWEREVPESGGMVVYGDGAVYYQTAEQFAAAPKFGAAATPAASARPSQPAEPQHPARSAPAREADPQPTSSTDSSRDLELDEIVRWLESGNPGELHQALGVLQSRHPQSDAERERIAPALTKLLNERVTGPRAVRILKTWGTQQCIPHLEALRNNSTTLPPVQRMIDTSIEAIRERR
jgi:hypothetical protein